MNITEFAASRNVKAQAVSRYITRHSADFEGHVHKDGKQVILSDEAVARLEAVYPLPKPIEVIVDHESRDKLLAAQARIIQLQEQLATQAQIVARAEYQEALLTMRNEEIELAKADVARQTMTITEQTAELAARDEEIRQLRDRLAESAKQLEEEKEKRDRMEQAGLFQRLLKKWG